MDELQKTISELQAEYEEKKKQIDEKYKRMLQTIQKKTASVDKKLEEWRGKGESFIENHKRSVQRFLDKQKGEINDLSEYADKWIKAQTDKAAKDLNVQIVKVKEDAKKKAEQRAKEKKKQAEEKAKIAAEMLAKLNTPMFPKMPIRVKTEYKLEEEKFEVFDPKSKGL